MHYSLSYYTMSNTTDNAKRGERPEANSRAVADDDFTGAAAVAEGKVVRADAVTSVLVVVIVVDSNVYVARVVKMDVAVGAAVLDVEEAIGSMRAGEEVEFDGTAFASAGRNACVSE